MIKFRFDKSTIRKLSKESTVLLCKPFWIFAFLSAILSIFFLLVGYLDDAEALIYGYPFLIIAILLILETLVFSYRINKGNNLRYETYNKDGFIDYSVSFFKDEFEVSNLNSKSIKKFHKAEIVNVKVTKSFIFIRLTSKQKIPLLKTEETLHLLKDCGIKKK